MNKIELPSMEIINELPYLRYQFQEIPEIRIVNDFALPKRNSSSGKNHTSHKNPLNYQSRHLEDQDKPRAKLAFSSERSKLASAQRLPYVATSCGAITSV